MNLSRRTFFAGAAAGLIVAPAIVRASSLMKVKPFVPFIHGDRIYCDADGLQAALDGEKYEASSLCGGVISSVGDSGARRIYIGRGTFLLTKTLNLRGNSPV